MTNATRTTQDLTGNRYGRWSVTAPAPATADHRGKKQFRWHATCDCGVRRVVQAKVLRSGGSTSCGCSRKLEQVSYAGAHSRVTKARGRASSYPCRDCGAPAAEWSYDHEDPAELVDPERGGAHSGDPSHYDPRCHSCHSLFDRKRETPDRVVTEDLVGQTFNRLTVEGRDADYVKPSGAKLPRWICRCSCGRTSAVLGINLRSGNTKSCGCLAGRR